MKFNDVLMIDLVELDDVVLSPSETKMFLPSRPKYLRRRQNMMMNPIPPAHPVVALQMRMGLERPATSVTTDMPVVVNPLMDSKMASEGWNPSIRYGAVP